MDNRSSSHSMEMPVSYSFYSKVLYGKLREDVREILSTLCKYKDVDIITNAVFVDYVHLIVVLPPKLSISNFKGYLKGKSTKQLVISPTKQYKNILKSKQRNQEKKIQEVPLYKRISNNACGTALCGEQ